MRFLLDTHVFLWYIEDAPQLSAKALQIMGDGENEIYLSMASVWEIAIKFNLGKLKLNLGEQDFPSFVSHESERNLIQILPIELAHIAIVAAMPQHHRDPFDRLLIAQAQAENLTLLSADNALDSYDVQRIW